MWKPEIKGNCIFKFAQIWIEKDLHKFLEQWKKINTVEIPFPFTQSRNNKEHTSRKQKHFLANIYLF